MKKHKYRYLLLLLLLFSSLCRAQLPCNTFPRDRIASCYHSTIMLTPEDSVKYWGHFAHPDTSTTLATGRAVLRPHTLNPSYYSGTPVAVAACGNDQLFLLTTGALYGWGKHYGILTPLSGSEYANIQQMPLPDSALTGTVDLDASDIATIEACYGAIILVTEINNPGRTNGEVYVKGNLGDSYSAYRIYGDGIEYSNADWHKVTIEAPGMPALNHVIRVSGGVVAAMALTDDGSVYAWGDNIYQADGSLEVRSLWAVPVLLPQEDGEDILPRDIVMAPWANFSITQFILGENGRVYSIGRNSKGILGNGVEELYTETVWNKVVAPAGDSGSVLEGIVQLSSANNSGFPCINALGGNGLVYGWGWNVFSILEGSGSFYTAPHLMESLIDGADTGRIALVEMGGHTSLVIHDSTYAICYIGHRMGGSMGDGEAGGLMEGDASGGWEIAAFDCTGMPYVPICTPLSSPDTTDTTTDTTGTTGLVLPYNPKDEIRAYPNPVEDRLIISGLTGGAFIRITDVTGRIVLQETNKKDKDIVMQFSSLSGGLYFIYVIDLSGRQKIFKIRKQ